MSCKENKNIATIVEQFAARADEIVKEVASQVADEDPGCKAVARAFKLEAANTARRSIQEMLLAELNPQFAVDRDIPMEAKLPVLWGMSIDLQRKAYAYTSTVDDITFRPGHFDPQIQAHAVDVAVSAVQLLDLCGPEAVESFLNELEASNRDIHLRIPTIHVF